MIELYPDIKLAHFAAVYIVLGTFALKRGRTPRIRLTCFIAAVAVYASMFNGVSMRTKTFVSLCLTFLLGLSVLPASAEKIPIYVTPFYNSQGPVIKVGKYSKSLATNNVTELRETVASMATNKIELTPEQMFVAAIRLYELGDKDEAIYWFYEAQVRAREFMGALKDSGGMGSKGFELKHAYSSFMQLAGMELNGYAGCDIDNWQATLKRVAGNNEQTPDLKNIFPGVKFVAKDQWQNIHSQTVVGLQGLSDYLENARPTWKQERAANKADERYCE